MPNRTLTYRIENRTVQVMHGATGTERYVYDPSGQRVWNQEPSRTMVYFYSVDGTLLATYGDGSNTDYNVYFAGKQIWAETAWGSPTLWAGPVALDRLGSVVHRYGSANRYFPYGDEPATTTQDRVKFSTYYRDQTSTLDYARNRYYSRSIGRFTSPDPYMASGGPADPQSWNRYAYVQNDPVNFSDPTGLMMKSNDCSFSFWGDEYCTVPGPWSGGYWWNGIEWEYPDPIAPWLPAPQAEREKRRGQIDIALAAIFSIVPRDNNGLPLRHWPAAIQMVDMCSTTGLNGGYELHVTYQVISELGTPMSGQQLAGFAITESFLSQTGTLGDFNRQAGTWSYPRSIDSDGQFIDILSSGGLPGFPRRGTALQQFTATGWFGVQPLDVLGFGGISTSGVNENYYSPEMVTVNGKRASHECN